ncbi:MAG: 7-cyano-7-deazaguanine synthase QueC [Bdellovibrionales bacterium]
MNSSVVLLSSGLDSTVNLYEAKHASKVVLALTFDYGQKAARQEKAHSEKICRELSISHRVIELPWFRDFTNTSLVSDKSSIPTHVNLQSRQAITDSAAQVWVPNRNGIFLSIAAAFAESLKAEWLIPGFNAEEATTFPDNSQEYLDSFTDSLKFSTMGRVKVKCFTTHLEKSAIYARGKELGVNFQNVWPCYQGNDKPCGACESCQRFLRAQDANP